MAAPSSTKWGNTVTGSKSTRKGKIGIYTGVTTSNTQVTVNVQVWFYSMYSVDDVNNTYTYNGNEIGSKTIKHTVETGEGWSTSNQTKLGESTYTYDRGSSDSTKTYSAKFTGIDTLGSSNVMSVSASVTVPALSNYTVTYNANGGSGAPSSQTKYNGKSLTLSSTKPTRSGYVFSKWNTKSDGSGTSYNPGASYTSNANLTLYAIWTANTYTVTYNANGGSGAPSSQTKTYGKDLTLSSTKPTRANYTFRGWATSAGGNVAYSAGAKYTTNASVTLYAIWTSTYKNPVIYNLKASRCLSDGTLSDEGTYLLLKFDWETYQDVTGINVSWTSTVSEGSTKITASGTSSTVNTVIKSTTFDIERTYTVTVVVSDSGGSSPPASTTLPGAIFPIDVLNGGKGIAFGKPAETEGVADFAFETKFNKPVYGKALGMDKLPRIPAGAELNNYTDPGCYAITLNADAAKITTNGALLGSSDNIPPAMAGRLEVWSATGSGVLPEEWTNLRQRYVPYTSTYPTFERDVARGSDNQWRYYDWWKSSLSPDISNRIYHKQKVLATTGMVFTSGHSVTLSEPVSKQMHGIVLVFCAYADGAVQNYDFISYYVPKQLIAELSGRGHSFPLMRIDCVAVSVKFLYIDDTRVWGDDRNEKTGTGSNISYKNNGFVLRYIYGV